MEEMIHNLSLAMLSNHCEPYVLAPIARKRDNTLNVPYPILRYQRPSSKHFGVRQILLPLLWYHLRYRFDVLHCHGVFPPGYVGLSFHKITGCPFVITSHGGDIKKNDRGVIINSGITANIKKALCEANAVTVVSNDMKEQILRLGADPRKFHILPNGIFVDEFKPSIKQSNNVNSYILYLGRLREDKGIDILIQAFSAVNEIFPDVRLKIAGEGREKKNLMTLADKLGLGHSIEFLGIIRGSEKIQLLQDALLLVCPSRKEAFGIVNLEAFASGIPVVASRVGGIPDIVEDGVNGFLVDPDNPQHLADKIILLLSNTILRNDLSKNALKKASYYDWSHIAQEYIQIYHEIRQN
jgi:glycosyltransferase involved in cell wall biosynthesis